MISPDQKKILAVAALLFIAGAAVGAYGVSIVKGGSYTVRDKTRQGTTSREIRGPEAVSWGWTLSSGAAATLAWSAILAFPPLPRPRFFHFGLVGLAFAAIAVVFLLRMPPIEEPADTRASAFYASVGFMIVAVGVLALLKERGLPPVGVALAVAVGAALYRWGFKGLEGMMLSLMALMLLGLHAAAYVGLVKAARTPT